MHDTVAEQLYGEQNENVQGHDGKPISSCASVKINRLYIEGRCKPVCLFEVSTRCSIASQISSTVYALAIHTCISNAHLHGVD